MLDILFTTQAQAVMMLAALAILSTIGYYIVRRFRDQSGDDQMTANDLLTNFRELHDQGDISEKEYRTIKTVLGERLQDELKDTGDTG
jgi:uncharacterized membrane protein